MHVGGTMRVTPLFMASLNANERLVKAFLKAGADPTVPIPDGSTGVKIIEDYLSTSPHAVAAVAAKYASTLEVLCEAAVARFVERRDALAVAMSKIVVEAVDEGVVNPQELSTDKTNAFAELFINRRDEPPEAVFLSMASSFLEMRNRGEADDPDVPQLPELYKQLITAGGASQSCGEALVRRHEAWFMMEIALRMLDRILEQYPSVHIVGLASKPEYNGQPGFVAGKREASEQRATPNDKYVDRYPVRLTASGRTIKVRPQNLRLVGRARWEF